MKDQELTKAELGILDILGVLANNQDDAKTDADILALAIDSMAQRQFETDKNIETILKSLEAVLEQVIMMKNNARTDNCIPVWVELIFKRMRNLFNLTRRIPA